MASFFLTHQAMHDLLEIESWSTEVFGVLRTRKYMKDLWAPLLTPIWEVLDQINQAF